jgi:hypothetical protein
MSVTRSSQWDSLATREELAATLAARVTAADSRLAPGHALAGVAAAAAPELTSSARAAVLLASIRAPGRADGTGGRIQVVLTVARYLLVALVALCFLFGALFFFRCRIRRGSSCLTCWPSSCPLTSRPKWTPPRKAQCWFYYPLRIKGQGHNFPGFHPNGCSDG